MVSGSHYLRSISREFIEKRNYIHDNIMYKCVYIHIYMNTNNDIFMFHDKYELMRQTVFYMKFKNNLIVLLPCTKQNGVKHNK